MSTVFDIYLSNFIHNLRQKAEEEEEEEEEEEGEENPAYFSRPLAQAYFAII